MIGSAVWACLLAVTPLPNDDLVSRLVQALNDSDRDVRQNVASALASLGKQAVPALRSALNDPEPLRRASAAYALGLIGRDAAESMPDLLKTLNDPESDVRRQASLAISRLVAITGNPRPNPVRPVSTEPPPPERFPDMTPVPLPRTGR
jgi:HEAT repeat protein